MVNAYLLGTCILYGCIPIDISATVEPWAGGGIVGSLSMARCFGEARISEVISHSDKPESGEKNYRCESSEWIASRE